MSKVNAPTFRELLLLPSWVGSIFLHFIHSVETQHFFITTLSLTILEKKSLSLLRRCYTVQFFVQLVSQSHGETTELHETLPNVTKFATAKNVARIGDGSVAKSIIEF